MASGESPAAACTFLASLERHGLLAIDPRDNDLGDLCRAVRQGATTAYSPGSALSETQGSAFSQTGRKIYAKISAYQCARMGFFASRFTERRPLVKRNRAPAIAGVGVQRNAMRKI